MCLKLLLYNLVDDQHLEKHVLLIQPTVGEEHRVCLVRNEAILDRLGTLFVVHLTLQYTFAQTQPDSFIH